MPDLFPVYSYLPLSAANHIDKVNRLNPFKPRSYGLWCCSSHELKALDLPDQAYLKRLEEDWIVWNSSQQAKNPLKGLKIFKEV